MAFAYDDPDDDSVVQSLLINAFGGATMSHDRSHRRAHCTPIIAANRFIVDQLSTAEERLVDVINDHFSDKSLFY